MLAGRLAPAAAQPAVLAHCRQLQHARLKLIVPQRALAAGNPAFSPPAAAPRGASPGALAAPRPSKTTPHPWRCGAVQQLSSAAVDAAVGRLAAAAAPLRVIGPGEVHLWWLDPKKAGGAAELARCAELLTEEELQYCGTAGEEGVQRERMLARALVRSVLAGYLPGSPHPRSLVFGRNMHGKPALLGPHTTAGGHRLRFNLTHTGAMIGLAVTVEGLVGLDVEGLERRTRGDPMRLARRRFSPQEIADLQACPDDEARTAYFLQLWTLKEAYVKALGRGISAPPGLRSFSFRVQANGHNSNGHNCDGLNGSSGGSSPAASSSSSSSSSLDGDCQAGGCAGSPQQEAPQQAAVQQAPPAAAWEGQEQRQPNVPQHLVVQAPVLWYSLSSGGGNGNGSSLGSNGGSISSMSSLVSASLDFLPTAQESRRWQFALLQPAPGLVSALCVERRLLAAGHCGQHEQEGMRLLSFEAAGPWGGLEQPLSTQVLAVGQYDPS
ncbi:L-aminoadipate-semialdehyde dehydrogenase-phosphopantetheinyl transferase isoform X2 [Chlorella sorokiniana]|uniref:holo-[acyl-carrier-protein] synthase n=1 Tax=Chlorella sorokiniana TaxID=3076 RepID=A0A2P6TSG2_CHLSO|nr:L-aminoadipate-semialdehyde dehydrogenase-phosphopantetheinyl transferase isoform X2 [Chlorella sorokiniana]|eukprot:PRW56999.1 L-aminoadipate-semialdehyde dehydrogenase-phosphopantetheinyl transferase isoform X2 [Chlorella sorokiniana]